jgi:hypothetical protein
MTQADVRGPTPKDVAKKRGDFRVSDLRLLFRGSRDGRKSPAPP